MRAAKPPLLFRGHSRFHLPAEVRHGGIGSPGKSLAPREDAAFATVLRAWQFIWAGGGAPGVLTAAGCLCRRMVVAEGSKPGGSGVAPDDSFEEEIRSHHWQVTDAEQSKPYRTLISRQR